MRELRGTQQGYMQMNIEDRKGRFLSSIIAVLICVALGIGSANAQRTNDKEGRPEQKTKQAQAVSKVVYDRILKAQEAIDEEDFDEALALLNRMLKGTKPKLTEYETINVLNYVGFVMFSTENIAGAMDAYRKLLAIPSLEEQTRKATVYTMAQLSTMEEDYSGAIKLLEEWFTLESNPAPDPFILYAQNLYQVERYADMIKPIESAMEIAKKRNKRVKEDWYTLLNFAYFQQENYPMVRDIQKILLVTWPKKRYWFSLAGAYNELGEETNFMHSWHAAHTQGLLERETELITMAQLYMANEVPYLAGVLIEKEMQSGRVKKDGKNYRMLSQAWQLAQEDEKSIPALQEAAKQSDEGELNLRLGNAYLNLGRYGECVAAITAGIRKGGIKSPDNAQISLGMCLYNQKKYNDSIAAFRQAAKTNRSKRISNQWIRVIQSDIQREEQIRLAERAARKQQEELAKRRRSTDRI